MRNLMCLKLLWFSYRVWNCSKETFRKCYESHKILPIRRLRYQQRKAHANELMRKNDVHVKNGAYQLGKAVFAVGRRSVNSDTFSLIAYNVHHPVTPPRRWSLWCMQKIFSHYAALKCFFLRSTSSMMNVDGGWFGGKSLLTDCKIHLGVDDAFFILLVS